jgi:hypothetical protein
MAAVQTPIRITFENILLATDFSSHSERALRFALGSRNGATRSS